MANEGEQTVTLSKTELTQMMQRAVTDAAANIVAVALEEFAKGMLKADVKATTPEARIGAELALKQAATSAFEIASQYRTGQIKLGVS